MADTDVLDPKVAADADTKTKAADDAAASNGSDEPKTYSKEAYDKLKNESISRREKIDSLTKANTGLVADAAVSEAKVKKLAALISGDEPEDTESDLDTLTANFTKQNKITETMFRNTLLKSTFLSESVKHNFHDPAFVYSSLNLNDERLKVSLVDQTVEGMNILLDELAKKAPFLLKADEEPDDKSKSKSVKAPGSRSSSETENPSDVEALKAIQKKGEEIGGEEGAVHILIETAKLKAK